MRLLSDPIRLRILSLLEEEELSVGELCRALALAQSRVSNHLRLLRESGMLAERHVGTSTFVRTSPGKIRSRLAARLWSSLRAELGALPEHAADRVRLASVLAARPLGPSGFFDRLAGEWDKLAGAFETGRARERSAAHLLPAGMVLADLGCGTGYMGEALLGNCARLICVDRSEAMLAEARKRLLRAARGTALDFRLGDLDRLPIADGELDGCVVGMVLHHLAHVERAVEEIRRVLKPLSAVAVLELAPHREEWMREELGDRHLGLPPDEVLATFERAGFSDLALDPVEDRYRPRRSSALSSDDPVSLSLYIVRARAPKA